MSAEAVIHCPCDVVSKNGNLLLSVPVRGDGSIDSEEWRIVEQIGSWMSRFGDAIYDTRPWRVAGEGPTQVASGQFGEGSVKEFTAEDIRFTTKNDTLFAITLGRPKRNVVSIVSLANAKVERIQVVGAPDHLSFTQDGTGLHVQVPTEASHEFGLALEITGTL